MVRTVWLGTNHCRIGRSHGACELRPPAVGRRWGGVERWRGRAWESAGCEERVDGRRRLDVPVAAEQTRSAAAATCATAPTSCSRARGEPLEMLHRKRCMHCHQLRLGEGARHVVRPAPHLHLRLTHALQVHGDHAVLLPPRRLVPRKCVGTAERRLALVLLALGRRAIGRARSGWCWCRCRCRCRWCSTNSGGGRCGGRSAQPGPQCGQDAGSTAGRVRARFRRGRLCWFGRLALIAGRLAAEDVGAARGTFPISGSDRVCRSPLAARDVPLVLRLGHAADVHVLGHPRLVWEGEADAHVARRRAAVERVDVCVATLLEEGVELAAPAARHLLQAYDRPPLRDLDLELAQHASQPRLGYEITGLAVGKVVGSRQGGGEDIVRDDGEWHSRCVRGRRRR
mmetsp:Transcript_20863/g.48085  ORF Transcript_20863/g.48085 Transcript_20863/m.48085 type:complete len:399 (+) Transcript_20863:302-1498(+)